MQPDTDFRLIADATYDWESWIAADGRLRWVNPAVTRISGYGIDDCLDMPDYPGDMIWPADLPAFALFRQAVGERRDGNDLPLRLQRKDGAVIWVALSWRPLYDAEGCYLGVRTSIRDTTRSMHNAYIDRLRPAVSQLMRDAMQPAVGVDQVFRMVCECAARTLVVERVGVWLFDDAGGRLVCANLFLQAENRHEQGQSINATDYPNYVAAISGDQLVIASDAINDDITRELARDYLQPLGIVSMLDAPIVREGRTIGVLCHEHQSCVRYWNASELAFVEALADLLALTLESAERRALVQQTHQLASIIEAMPDLVATVALDGKPMYINPAGMLLLGGHTDFDLAKFNIADVYSEQALQFRRDVALPTAWREGHWSGETQMHTLAGDTVPVWQTLIAHRDALGNVQYLSSIVRDLREQKRIEEQLRAREQSLQALNAELEQRVAERTRKLEEVNRNLEAFAYSVSHDLKAPLRGIDGYSRLLLEDYRDVLPGEAPQFIDNIRFATERMHQLIDDLLAYSRLGRRDLARTQFKVRQVLERILAERQHDIDARHVVIINQVGEIEIHADLDCFIQLLRNLVDNAIKFTRDAARPLVVVSVSETATHTQICVRDNGCGFDMKYHDRIFAIFQRLHRNEEYPGTGVGLAIVGKAAERMGGRVWAHSEVGKGAEFFLELPK